MTLFLHDRPFLRRMLALALPVSVQLLISTSINMADTVMISSLGGASIAAVGLVNQFVFFFMVVSFGICSAGAVFFAQYFGSRDMLNVRRYLSIALQLAVSVALVFMVISLLFPERIMRLLIPDPEVIRLGTGYLQIIALTFVFTGISQCFNTVLRSVNRANEPLKVSVIAFFTNVFFNYIFIFGKFGAPALGVVGAAIGTLIARVLEIALLSWMIWYGKNIGVDVRPAELLHFHKDRMKRYFQIALPIIAAETQWSFAQLLFAVAYARIGAQAAAAMQLTTTIQNVFFILVNSMASAAAVLIGHALGAEEKERARTESGYFIQLTLITGLLSTAVLAFLPDLLLSIYSGLEPGLYQTARALLIIRGLFITFRFLNGMLFVGIFRAGGDTKIPFLIEICTMWIFAIPMAFAGVLLLQWPVEWIFVIVSMEEFIKMFALVPRYRSGKWMRNITGEEESHAV
ncbi:MAG: MATE family efflux transporter [Tissierellia bacterium]|jgi:putative MATE family efflux protein|nr:MATE family efflux transporter [Tissierellia bacterium]